VIDNNGDLEDLHRNTTELIDYLIHRGSSRR